jgi:hypothetical protein
MCGNIYLLPDNKLLLHGKGLASSDQLSLTSSVLGASSGAECHGSHA